MSADCAVVDPGRPALVTGGAGFIGSNLAHRLLQRGRQVVLFDDLSRPGVERNVERLRGRFRDRVKLVVADVRDRDAVKSAVARASDVFHCAGQVAVTASVADPLHDFAVNTGGTLNVLEALRAVGEPKPLVYTSTNKVYGALPGVVLQRAATRWEPAEASLRDGGIDEHHPLEFHSPYGCSKGTADQYVLDYARTFGVPAVVFRMSCVYGPHQYGTEDQGWVAHFAAKALAGQPIRMFGDGLQVRDLLYVEDVVDAMLLGRDRIGALRGRAFNLGGGPAQALSLLETLALIDASLGTRTALEGRDPRLGDQRWYVSDTRRFQAATGWRPTVAVEEGVGLLCEWIRRSDKVAVPTAREALT